jgi:hypothetical protein
MLTTEIMGSDYSSPRVEVILGEWWWWRVITPLKSRCLQMVTTFQALEPKSYIIISIFSKNEVVLRL